ncbi:PD40 domain-containing protein [Nocardioides stalactiti]|uniref:PD40 domain-containing protein n=1 Tax=Nocardioides stalactiti TaxID=2755356 RepID=UPI001600C173|nr:PD40 domain-containing protein [Nocardioides stalactiti]
MRSTLGLRRLLSLTLPAVLAAVLAAVPYESAVADPAEQEEAKVAAGTNGVIVTMQQYYDGNGLPTSASLRGSNQYGYFHEPDSSARTNDPEWAPDGIRMAYSAYGGAVSAQGLWVVANPLGHTTNFLQLTTSQYDTDPTWSPDGKQIAFARSQSGDGGIWVVDATGGAPIPILRNTSYFPDDLAWSPDGTRIAFAGFSGRAFDSPVHVFVVDVDGGTPVDLGLGSAPSWSPDGSRIAFQFPFSSTDVDIGTMDPDGTDRYAVIGSTRNEYEPTWSPDGTSIAFIAADGVNVYSFATGSLTVPIPGSNYFSTTWAAQQPTCLGRAATMSGSPGNDTLRGSRGVDVIHGMGGNDTILGLQGQDLICGGPGADTVSYAGQASPVRAYLGEIDPHSGVSDLIAGDVENLVGGSGPDVLVGDDAANRLDGGGGEDRLDGAGGADVLLGRNGEDILVGDDGNDLLVAGNGEDALRGGDGTDTLDGGFDGDLINGGGGTDSVEYELRTIGVNVSLGSGAANDGSREDGTVGERDTVRGSVENVVGGSGADTLVGSEVANQLTGGAGADTLRGGGGRDVLRANDGARDAVIDCGDGDDAAAVRDAVDPAPISCP